MTDEQFEKVARDIIEADLKHFFDVWVEDCEDMKIRLEVFDKTKLMRSYEVFIGSEHDRGNPHALAILKVTQGTNNPEYCYAENWFKSFRHAKVRTASHGEIGRNTNFIRVP